MPLTIKRVGDWFQVLVDVEIADEDAAAAGDRVMSWLIETGVIGAEQTDCVLDADTGYPPGGNYGHAIGNSSADAPRFWTNGVSFHVGRRVYYTLGALTVGCQRCGYREDLAPVERTRWQTDFFAAFDDWQGGGSGSIPCLGCGHANGLNDWDWGPNPWAFGAFGLTFWNWAPLADSFIDEMRAMLGHRIIYNADKL